MNKFFVEAIKTALAGVLIFAVILLGFTVGAKADETPVHTAKQEAMHQIAEMARAAGLPEDHPIITNASAIWWQEQEDLNILARVISGEANYCPYEHQCAVAGVVLNRVRDDRFPGSVYDVVAQPGQYSTRYLSGFEGVSRQCYEAAAAAMNGEVDMPGNVVWQAQFVQGSGVWWASYVDTGWWRSTTYFCW